MTSAASVRRALPCAETVTFTVATGGAFHEDMYSMGLMGKLRLDAGS
jgi:hypothetical protein